MSVLFTNEAYCYYESNFQEQKISESTGVLSPILLGPDSN